LVTKESGRGKNLEGVGEKVRGERYR